MAFLQELASKTVLRRAWESVAANRGVAGVDRVSIRDFAADLERNLEGLVEEVRSRSYRPLPVLRIRPSFLDSGDRALVVPTVRDRVLQRAIADLLRTEVEATFSPACRAFRRGSSAIAAAADVGRWVERAIAERGSAWVLRADVAKFFDSIRRDVLRSQLEPFVDAQGLDFLDRLLRCRIFDHQQVSETVVGIAQGSPLSPLLGNLYLNEVDHELLSVHSQTIRYCDDLLVLEASEELASTAQRRLEELLEPLGLELNQGKTRVGRAEDGFVFLGFHFSAAGRGPAVKAVAALRCRLAEIDNAEHMDPVELDAIYRGWTGYFGEHPHVWQVSPVGVLALLRNASASPSAELIAERWRQGSGGGGQVSRQLAFELASAWSEAGRPEQSWIEMAMACGGSRAGRPDLGRWARLLGVDTDALEELARLLVGPAGDRLGTLAEAVAELGQYAAASALAAAVPELLPVFAGESVGNPAPADLASDGDLRLLVEWFAGREGVHAELALNAAGHRRYVSLRRPISEDDWRAHLEGEKILALPLVRAGNDALIGVLDVDVSKRALAEHPIADELLGRALATASTSAAGAREAGVRFAARSERLQGLPSLDSARRTGGLRPLAALAARRHPGDRPLARRRSDRGIS